MPRARPRRGAGFRRTGTAILLTTLLVAACSGAGEMPATTETPVAPAPTSTDASAYTEGSVLHTLLSDGRFTTFAGIIENEDVGRALEFFGNPNVTVTVFAPTDEAFRALDDKLLASLLDDRASQRWFGNHVVGERADGDALTEAVGGSFQSLGVALPVAGSSDEVTIAGVPIIETDLATGNSVVHAAGAVILPCDDQFLNDVVGPDYADVCTG